MQRTRHNSICCGTASRSERRKYTVARVIRSKLFSFLKTTHPHKACDDTTAFFTRVPEREAGVLAHGGPRYYLMSHGRPRNRIECRPRPLVTRGNTRLYLQQLVAYRPAALHETHQDNRVPKERVCDWSAALRPRAVHVPVADEGSYVCQCATGEPAARQQRQRICRGDVVARGIRLGSPACELEQRRDERLVVFVGIP